MTMLSWIRWKYFAPLAIVVAAIVVFFVFFFDPLLARGIEKAGSMANGAKVEVSGLKTKFFSGRLAIAHVAVADRAKVMQNRVEAGPLAFQMSMRDLFARRVIIDEATMSGLAFDTPRKTSGALPPRLEKKKQKNEEPGPAAKLAEKYKDRFKLNLDGIKGDVKAKIDFDPKDLQLVKSSNELKAKAEGLPGAWEQRAKSLNVDERVKKVEAQLKAIKETPTSGSQAITAIPESLNKLKETKAELDALKKEVEDAKATATSDLKSVKDGVLNLSQAKKADLDDLMSRLNLDFANPERLVEGMVGPLVLQRFQTVFHYIQLARERMPSKKDKEIIPERPRPEGTDIEFPTPAAPPRFWLKKGGLDGTYETVKASGELLNLTSDPARVGQPFKLNLNGAQGLQKFLFQTTLDHTGTVNKDSLVLQVSGLDAKKLVTDNMPVNFTEGSGTAAVLLNLIGDEGIGGDIKLSLAGLKIDPASLTALSGGEKIKADFMQSLARAIEGMKEVAINAQVYGTWQDPNLKITSNLTGAFANVLKDSIGNAAKEQRAQLEARLDQILSEQRKELEGKISGLDGKLGGQFGGLQSQVEKALSEAAGISLGGDSPIPGVKVPSLKGLFKK